MRLTCPNCNAQYEVDDAVIPQGGRDVQCSSCGHTWYQYPKDVALEMRAAELDEDDDDDDTPAGGRAASAGARAAPRIDKTVLDVLREEADREIAARQRDTTGVETQGDLGLTRPGRARTAAAEAPRPAADEAEPPESSRRRNLLPDIEELTSTLEPGSERRGADEAEDLDPTEETRGFRRGLSVMFLIAAALVALYVLAPVIGAQVPVIRGPLTLYVDTIDGLRAMVAGLLRSVIGG